MNEIDLIRQKEIIEACSFSSSLSIPKLLKERRIFLENVEILRNEIRKTEIYHTLADEYQMYIDLLSSFFQQQGITDSKRVNIFYQNLLNLGYLSYQNSYTYDQDYLSNNYGMFECEELKGARVASGIAVCRHTTMMLNDLQNTLKNHSYYLSAFAERGILVEKIARRLQLAELAKPNHAINLLKTDDDLFYGYCSTGKLFFNIIQKDNELILSSAPSSRRDTFSLKISKAQSEEEKWQNFLQENKCNEHEDRLNKIFNLPSISIHFKCTYNQKIKTEPLNSGQLMKLEKEVFKQTIDNKKEIEEFYGQTKEQLYRIHSLHNRIVPLTKEKVKSLRIR